MPASSLSTSGSLGATLRASSSAASASSLRPARSHTLEICRYAGAACGPLAQGAQNNAVEPKSGRSFFLEYPCGLKAGDKVVVGDAWNAEISGMPQPDKKDD